MEHNEGLHAAGSDALSVTTDDREQFYLRAALSAAREISGVIQPRRILEISLLAAMGPVGAVSGACLHLRREGEAFDVVSKGLTADALEALSRLDCAELRSVLATLPTVGMTQTAGFEQDARDAMQASLDGSGLNANDFSVVVPWRADTENAGLLILGSRLSGAPLEAEERQLVQEIARFMAGALQCALATHRIGQLNADLHRKNLELDRKVYQLGTVNDMTGELAALNDTQVLLDHFLLLVTGALGVNGGAVLLLDRERKVTQFAARGRFLDTDRSFPAPPPGFEETDTAMYNLAVSGSLHGLKSMGVALLRDVTLVEEELEHLGPGLRNEALSAAALFTVDSGLMGLCLLGPPISGGELAADQRDLFAIHLHSLLSFLKNARSFEHIQKLNENLSQRNRELEQTIADLTEARKTISLMEEFQRLMRATLNSEIERIGRASIWDYVLIFIVSAVVALAFNATSPNGIPLMPDHLDAPSPQALSAEEALAMFEKATTEDPGAGAVIVVDARPSEFYQRAHIPGAVNMPPGFFDMVYSMRLGDVELDRPILVYGRTISRLYDRETAVRLSARDHDDVSILDGGLEAWQEAGLPVESDQ